MAYEELKQALVSIVEDIDGVEIERGYSGRAMFGRECLGIKIERDGPSEILLGALLYGGLMAEDEYNGLETELEQVLRESRQDSLGMGTIIYFPEIDDYEGDEE